MSGSRWKNPLSVGVSLTPRQKEALTFIREYMGRTGLAPLLAEISEAMGGIAKPGVYELLRRLEQKGHLTIRPNVARGIVPTGVCPCCGQKIPPERS